MLQPFIYSLLFSLAVAHALPQVKLGKTVISGRDASDSVEFFGGIPYAEPPLGQLRFRPPVLKTRLGTATFNASAHGKACIQPFVEDLTTLSEDCLTVSIWRPAGLSNFKTKLPVLFWTYGGAYFVGSSSTEDGAGLVDRSIARGTPIIYVSFNHRLGSLGFPQGQEAEDRRALNLGILDQTAALEWLQANIHFFGGDSSKVTLFGQSSGSIMIAIQYLNPHFENLARAAIFESAQMNSLPFYTAAELEPAWQTLVNNTPSCASTVSSGNTLPCLRNATTEEITTAVLQSWENNFGPAIDPGNDSILPDYPSRLYTKGRFARLPFIAGTNLDEGTYFATQDALTDDALKALIIQQNGPAPPGSEQELDRVADRILELYPDDPRVGSPFGTGDELFGLPSSYKRQSSELNDLTFLMPRRQWSMAAAQAGIKAYGYQFTQPQANRILGVTHGDEVAYVHGRVPLSNTEGQRLSTAVMDYWISFTVSLDPNDGKGTNRPLWPQYTQADNVLLQLQDGNTTIVNDDFRKEQNEFLMDNALVLRR